jgi:hypothetical protein
MSSAMRNMRMFKVFTTLATTAIVAGATGSFAQAPTKLSRVLPLVRTDGTTVGENPGQILPKGTVKLEINGANQRFIVDAKNMDTSYPPGGLAVYIQSGSDIRYVSVLDQSGTNGHWKVDFKATDNQAPPQTGVTTLTDLVGSTVLVGPDSTNAVLSAVVLPLLPNSNVLNYQEKVPFNLPPTPLSLKANGYISVKYNGRTGVSVLDAKAKMLNAGNAYAAGEAGAILASTNVCESASITTNGVIRWRHDTGKGDALPSDENTIMDMSGQNIWVVDCFGGIHLESVIPFPPYIAPE